MRPPALNVPEILECAFATRDEDPQLFADWVSDVYLAKQGWHDQPDPEHWVHHASSLGECLRKHVIARTGSEREELTVQSRVTFQVGDIVHVLIQFGLAVHPDYVLLGHEIGGVATRDGVQLAAHADAVYLDPTGQCCIVDVKTEGQGKFKTAKQWRESDAERDGRETTEKPEHALQLQATAGVIHRLTEFRPVWGWIVYFGKASGYIDPQPVPLTIEPVIAELQRREDAWTDYSFAEKLPPVLDNFTADKGLCTARSRTDRRGVWCGHRVECERLWKESQKLTVIQGQGAA